MEEGRSGISWCKGNPVTVPVQKGNPVTVPVQRRGARRSFCSKPATGAFCFSYQNETLPNLTRWVPWPHCISAHLSGLLYCVPGTCVQAIGVACPSTGRASRKGPNVLVSHLRSVSVPKEVRRQALSAARPSLLEATPACTRFSDAPHASPAVAKSSYHSTAVLE